MQQCDGIKMTGRLEIVVRDQRGRFKLRKVVKNLVVTTGKNFLASRAVSVAAAVVDHMAVGTGATAPAAGDTTLQTELSRVALDSAGSAAANVCTYTATFPAGTATGALTEAGLFNAAAAGTMVCRTTFGTVTKSGTDAITITWTVTIN